MGGGMWPPRTFGENDTPPPYDETDPTHHIEEAIQHYLSGISEARIVRIIGAAVTRWSPAVNAVLAIAFIRDYRRVISAFFKTAAATQ